MTKRSELMASFLVEAGWEAAIQIPLAADASFRRYIRLELAGKTSMLMDAPPPQEDVRPFVKVAEHLNSLGLSAPTILSKDEKNGFLLLDDFGNNTFSKLLIKGHSESELYEGALDVLIHLQNNSDNADVNVPAYDFSPLHQEASLFVDWYWQEIQGYDCPAEKKLAFWQLGRACLQHCPKCRLFWCCVTIT